MGNSGCKPPRSDQAVEEDAESVESVSIGKGVRVHQLEGNNFLGKLEDASRMSYRGRGLWHRSSSNVPGTPAGRGSTTTGGGSSSARSSCYSDMSSDVWQQQHQHQHQHFLSTAPAATNSGLIGPRNGSRSLDCGPARAGGSSSQDNDESTASSTAAAMAAADASRMDLTTLLLQGFDPTTYEQRIVERRLAKFARRPSKSTAVATTAEEAPG